jgi:hypothetical protein
MIPLFIPYLNRPDLLERAVRSAVCNGVEINIINNSNGASIGIPGVDFIQRRPPVPLTFTQTQNWFLEIASADADYEEFYFFMHSDAEAGAGTVQKLVEIARRLIKEGRKWGVIFTAYDSLAVFNRDAFREVRGWDTLIEWYASDCDMYRRIKLAGYELVESNLPVKHEPSQTLNADPEIKRRVDLMFPFREYYYQEKWGGSPGKERFTTPFNR